MKVVHITTIDEGGAYKAVYRIHQALLLQGIESNILLRNKQYSTSIGYEFLDNSLKKLISQGKNAVNYTRKRNQIYRDILGSNVAEHCLVKDSDVIFLHWINSFLTIKGLEKIFRLNKPVIWVLHDMWPMTGGCHCALECTHYEVKCGNCPFISDKKENDLSRRNWLEKKELIDNVKPIFIGPSTWVVDAAKRSGLLRNKQVEKIPHCIKLDIFRPLDNIEKLKDKYGVPKGKRIILFGAAFDGINNTLKGFQYLLEALNLLDENRYALLVFGHVSKEQLSKIKQEIILAGYINNEIEMAELYNIADVYVSPSLQETFGFTVCESLACGTPAVTFKIGGLIDQIDHKSNGYLAEVKNVDDLVCGINYCASHVASMKNNACMAIKRYSYEKIGEKYKELLDSLNL